MKTLYGSDKLTASAQNRESFQILPVFFSLKNFDREKSYVLIIWEKRAWLAFKQLMVLPCKFKKSFIFIIEFKNLSETSYGVWLILREFMDHSFVHNNMVGEY